MIRRLFAAFSRYRPRALTLIVLMAIAGLLVLVNSIEEYGPRNKQPKTRLPAASELQFEAGEAGPPKGSFFFNLSYGWPLVWRQYVIFAWTPEVVGENCSAGRLAANVAIWLAILATPAGVCEWLMRRCRPRLRFSLRTLLVATVLAAALCAWFATAFNRANVQDRLIVNLNTHEGRVWGERWGPKWLDQIGAERFCRRILGIHVEGVHFNEESFATTNDGQRLRLLDDFRRLPDLQYLSLRVDELTPEIIAALGELRRLETLELEVQDELRPGMRQTLADTLGGMQRLRALSVLGTGGFYEDSQDCLAAIGSLGQLEHLRLVNWVLDGEDLALLAGLTNLKSLKLEDAVIEPGLPDSAPTLLASLPRLEKLEALDLEGSEVVDGDLPYIAWLPRLKSLNLNGVYLNGAALEELTPLESLEELAIDKYVTESAGLKALVELKQLKKLHSGYFDESTWRSPDVLSKKLLLSLEEAEACSKAYTALRKANPGLVIDDDDDALNAFGGHLAPKGEPIYARSQSELLRQAVQTWKEKKAGT